MLASSVLCAGRSIDGGSPIRRPNIRWDTSGRQSTACTRQAQTPAAIVIR
ncbi:MAG: DUF2890 domain-containing protein [Desulfobacterales bacterium]|nr:DUF2890 domain-containing protein [Desulfobacterales bacterium]